VATKIIRKPKKEEKKKKKEKENENEKQKKKKCGKRKKKARWSLSKIFEGSRIVGDLNCEIGVKGKRKVTFFLFFHFFHLFRQSPPKIFKSKMQPLHSPSHHEHHNIVLPTRYPTRWCWFYCDLEEFDEND